MGEPKEHIRWLNSCITLKADNPKHSLKTIALGLGIGHMTVKRALGYASLMTAAGMSEPYRELSQCPEVASRWRRNGEQISHGSFVVIEANS